MKPFDALVHLLILSPHPDDAVWSCGGMFDTWTSDGGRLDVVTVFDGGGARTTARRREDQNALGLWPLTAHWLGLTEAAHRTGPEGRPLYPGPLAVRREVHAHDHGLVPSLARRLVEMLTATTYDEVLLPLARRSHVDHELTRRAGERALAEMPTRPAARYYAEFPYVLRTGPQRRETTSRADWTSWLAGARCYHGEVEKMFDSEAAFETRLRHFAGASNGASWSSWFDTPLPPWQAVM